MFSHIPPGCKIIEKKVWIRLNLSRVHMKARPNQIKWTFTVLVQFDPFCMAFGKPCSETLLSKQGIASYIRQFNVEQTIWIQIYPLVGAFAFQAGVEVHLKCLGMLCHFDCNSGLWSVDTSLSAFCVSLRVGTSCNRSCKAESFRFSAQSDNSSE